jgi:glutathione S-transferase
MHRTFRTMSQAMHYLSIQEARTAPGLRLVLSAHVPGPWSESAKAMFKLRSVPFVPVAQEIMQANEELHDWLGIRNAPAAVLDGEPPVTNWLDLVAMAERLGGGPALLPRRSAERAHCLGISAEICAPGGFGWCCRLSIFEASLGSDGLPPYATQHLRERYQGYGYSATAAAQAPARIVGILEMLSSQLKQQKAIGSAYLVGHSLTSCDIHWACFSMMISPLPAADALLSAEVHRMYSDIQPEVAAALTPELVGHRDLIFQRHIGLPLDF